MLERRIIVMINNTFDDYNPSDFDEMFDRDDLLGISMLNDDPIYKKHTALKNLYNGIVDESTSSITTVTKAIEDSVDVEDTIEEPDLLDIEPDDSDVSVDGMDAEDEIEAAQDIFTGEADEDDMIIDFVESL